MSPGEFTTRAGFEVFFKSDRLGFIPEGNRRLEAPRTVFAGVGDFPGIVCGESVLEIVGQAHIMAVGIQVARQKVDVVEHGWPDCLLKAGLPSRRLAAAGEVRLRAIRRLRRDRKKNAVEHGVSQFAFFTTGLPSRRLAAGG